MRKFAGVFSAALMVIANWGAAVEAANVPYPAGNVYCDGAVPAYFMGVKDTEEDAITSVAVWTQEYRDAGGEIAAGEESQGKFGWANDWKIVGTWVWAAGEPAQKNPCTSAKQQGRTLECHFVVVHKDAPAECESCQEKAGLAAYGISLRSPGKK